jgi:hypothetical protein
LIFSSSPFAVIYVYAAIVKNTIATGPAKKNNRLVMVSKKLVPSSIFPLNTRYFQDSINQTITSEIIDHNILAFDSLSTSSSHLDRIICVAAIMITKIAMKDIKISIKPIMSLLRVFHKLKASKNKFHS